MSEAESDGRAQSLRNLLLGHEGPPISDEVAQSVVQRHRVFWSLQDELVENLVTDRIDRLQYLSAFNREVTRLAEDDQHILGELAYAAVFGSSPSDAPALIDDDVFLSGEPDEDFEADIEPGPRPG